METALPLSITFQLFAAFNAAMLGATALCRATIKSAPSLYFGGAALLLAAAAIALISLDHAGFSFAAFNLRFAESLLTLIIGPVFLGLVLTLHSRAAPAVALFGPPVLYAIVVGAILGQRHPLLSVPGVVLIQFAYTAVAWFVHVRAGSESNSAGGPGNRTAFWLLVAMTIVHVAQLARTLGADIAVMQNVVPVVTGVIFLAVTARVIWSGGPALIASLARRSSSDTDDDCTIVAELQQLIERDRIHLNRRLRLSHAAAGLGVTPNALSAAINSCTGRSFSAFITHERIDYARQLLASPKEKQTSVEALAMMSGFHSRSAFYRAFRAATGTSPADFRNKHQTRQE